MSAQSLMILLITLLAFGLRVYQLGAQSLWFDETYSALVGHFSLGDGWQALLADGVHPPLYYWMQKAGMAVIGETEFALRFPSVWFGTLAIPLILQLGKRWAGARAGIIAALLLALSPFHVWYSQDARMYAALAPLALSITLLFERLLQDGGRTQRILFVVLSATAYITHYAALLLPLAQLAYLLLNLRQRARVFRVWVALQFIAAIPIAGWFVALALRDGQYFGIGWIPAINASAPLYTLMNFSAGFVQPPGLLQWGALIITGTLAAFGLIQSRVAMRQVILWWAFLPIATLWLISFGRPLYVDRFFIISLPAYLLLIAVGVDSLRINLIAPVTIAVAVLFALGTLQVVYGSRNMKEDWRSAGAYLAQARPDETIAMRALQIAVPLNYYYKGSLPLQAIDANRQITPLTQLAEGKRGLWLVYWNAQGNTHAVASSPPFDPTTESDPVAAAWIAGDGPKLIERVDFTGITIFHFALTQ
jgi:4-amino-4-deoxy-L-arabinose transferase-like glycosyltransferase